MCNRLGRTAGLLVVCTSLAVVSPSYAQVSVGELKPGGGKAPAEMLLKKAGSAYDIRADGRKPFRLVASYRQLDPDGKVILGTMTLTWAAQDRWREEVKVGESTEIRVRNGVKVARLDRGTWGAREASVRKSLLGGSEIAPRLMSVDADQVSVTKAIPEGSPPTADVVIRPEKSGAVHGFRFDTSSGALLREDFSTGEHVVYENESRDGKLLPVTIKGFLGDRQRSLWALMEYSADVDSDSRQFEFPEGSGVWDYCVPKGLPKVIKQVNPKYPAKAAMAGLGGRVVLIALIGSQGRIEDVCVDESAGPLFDQAALEAVKQWVYQVPPCFAQQGPTDWPIIISFRPAGVGPPPGTVR